MIKWRLRHLADSVFHCCCQIIQKGKKIEQSTRRRRKKNKTGIKRLTKKRSLVFGSEKYQKKKHNGTNDTNDDEN